MPIRRFNKKNFFIRYLSNENLLDNRQIFSIFGNR